MFRLLIILLSLFGFENNKPKYDLHKQVSLMDKISVWFYRHRFELLLACIITSMVLIVLATVLWFPAMDPWTNRFDKVV